METLIIRRTIRKTFLLEGETVTMKYVKQLCGEERYGRMIEDYKKKTQFIIISHRKKTMEFADTLQGVTMAEKGVSSLITVRVSDYIKEE